MEDAPIIRRRLLLTALESGGANAKILALLRKWAKEGRPYKGHVFQPEEVENAIKAISTKSEAACTSSAENVPTPSRAPSHGNSSSQISASKNPKSTEGCASFVANRCVMVNSRGSRPKEVLEAAAVIARSLAEGPHRDKIATVGSNRELILTSLYEAGSGHELGRVLHSDFQIIVGESKVGVHKDIIKAMSGVVGARSAGLANETDAGIDGSQFGFGAVVAAVEFAYRGACKVPIGDLLNLCLFATSLQCSELVDAVENSLSSLPVVRSLVVLASVDIAAVEDQSAMSALLSRNVWNAMLQSSAKTFTGVAEVLNKTVTLGPTVATRSDDRVVQCWAFVSALHDALSQLSTEAMERLRGWICSEKYPLRAAVEKFMIEAIRSAGISAAAGVQTADLTFMCKRHFKAWLPEELILKIVREVAQRDGFVRHVAGPNGLVSSQPHRWLQWTFSGGPCLEVMWSMYDLVKGLIEESLTPVNSSDATGDTIAGTEPQNTTAEEGKRVTLGLPQMLVTSFGGAFIEEIYQNPMSANSWDVLQQGLDQHLPVAEKSLEVLVRHVGRGKALPPGLPPKMMSLVLSERLLGASASAVRVSGPPSIAGVFERSHGSKIEFKRKASEEGGPELVLRRVLRSSGRDAISIVWPGIPNEDCRRATAEWKIQQTDDDERFDCPLAVALTPEEDPCKIDVYWWMCVTKGRSKGQFQQDRSIEIQLESVNNDEGRACQDVLIAWVRAGGCLKELEEHLQSKAASGPVLLMCSEARKVLAASEPTDEAPPEQTNEDQHDEHTCQPEVSGTNPTLPEVSTIEEEVEENWRTAVIGFKPFVDELVEMLSAIRDSKSEEDLRRHLKRKRDLEETESYVKAIRRLEEFRET